ncbi:hypothetical protein LCGC14_2908940, partial [marine sediment metagenome]
MPRKGAVGLVQGVRVLYVYIVLQPYIILIRNGRTLNKIAVFVFGEYMNNPFIIAEIGINHNGSLNTARELIDMAVRCGCDAVKFQKRTIDLCYSK